ncbi:MAG: mechanosensitive ion channel family protein, partial [bacterium]
VLHQQFGVARRRQVVRLLLSLVSWAIIFIWVGAIAAAFYQFPQTRGIADRIVSIPVLILIAVFAAGLLNSLAGLLIDRIANAWSRSSDARTSLRVPTVAAALKGLVATVLYIVAVIAVLEYVLVIPFTIVALGAVAALAISFAAQNLVKDLVNGLLILAEDQYALGDDIAIGNVSGIVERLHVRTTQLRTSDGRLITIPNHLVTQVENKTRLWSRVDLRVTVAYATDVDRALAVVKEVMEETARDPRWRRLILDTPELLGVEDISHEGISIRFLVKTLPFKKEDVARELRRRLKIAFDHEGIRIGIPQHAIVANDMRGNDLLSGDKSRDRSERRSSVKRRTPACTPELRVKRCSRRAIAKPSHCATRQRSRQTAATLGPRSN